jgi:thiol:disulfide interchange protein DsbD
VVAAGSTIRPTRWEPLFDVMQAAVPGALLAKDVQAVRDGDRVKLSLTPGKTATKLDFFPLEDGRIEPSAPQTLTRNGAATTIAMSAIQPVAAEFTRLRGVLVADGGPTRGGWAGTVDLPLTLVGATAKTAAPVAGAVAVAGAGTVAPEMPVAPQKKGMTVWLALFGAFVGGLVLNLMPCVFPVLSLKLLGLVQHNKNGNHGPSLPAHGVAFGAGAIVSFVALAALLIALQAGGAQLGWGFQLQAPVVVGALIALFFAIGLNLLGAFEVTLLTGVANSSAAQKIDTGSGLKGSFGTGVLAVVVASPCTAPFMGAALGFAVTQPWPIALSVFGMLGVGMSTPYMLLTLFPPLLRRLPRPGVWMERFKQIMAFPMFATCVWLLWVMAQQVDANALAVFLFGLVALGMAAWALGIAQRGARLYRWLALASVAATAWTIFGLAGIDVVQSSAQAATARPAGAHADWAPWTPGAVQAQLTAGKPVFVDFTAAWCVTCQANKKLVLHREGIEKAFADRGVVKMKADWTSRDATITQELARYGRNGVPLYVLYDKAGKATVLPEILSENDVLGALAKLN